MVTAVLKMWRDYLHLWYDHSLMLRREIEHVAQINSLHRVGVVLVLAAMNQVVATDGPDAGSIDLAGALCLLTGNVGT